MKTIRFDDLMTFARSVEGQILRTLHRRQEFTVIVTDTSLVYIPSAIGTRTKDDRGCVQKICEEFSRTNEYRPSHYVQTLRAWHASYTLTLIHRCLEKMASN
jgi:hypothetical protein